MKRVGFDKAAFVKTAADLLPVVCQAWDAQWAAIASLLPTISGRDAIVSKGHSEAAAAVALGTVCVRVSGSNAPSSHRSAYTPVVRAR